MRQPVDLRRPQPLSSAADERGRLHLLQHRPAAGALPSRGRERAAARRKRGSRQRRRDAGTREGEPVGRRPFTVRTLLVWMVLFALLCGGLSASGVAASVLRRAVYVGRRRMVLDAFVQPPLALGLSIAIPVFYGAVLVLTARSSKGPPPRSCWWGRRRSWCAMRPLRSWPLFRNRVYQPAHRAG